MKLTHVSVANYKGLRAAKCPLSDFVCAIGENNAGKSSLLQALLLFINGPKLSKTAFYNPGEDILIVVALSGVNTTTLAKLTEDHRSKLIPYVKEECITLARRYAPEGSSKPRKARPGHHLAPRRNV
jgi:putative ATP-dependent endonuclease of OLD family